VEKKQRRKNGATRSSAAKKSLRTDIIAPLRKPLHNNEKVSQEGTPTTTKDDEECYYLVVTLQSKAGNDHQATASLVEVLDLGTISKAFDAETIRDRCSL
jgi:hypothetical protein